MFEGLVNAGRGHNVGIQRSQGDIGFVEHSTGRDSSGPPLVAVNAAQQRLRAECCSISQVAVGFAAGKLQRVGAKFSTVSVVGFDGGCGWDEGSSRRLACPVGQRASSQALGMYGFHRGPSTGTPAAADPNSTEAISSRSDQSCAFVGSCVHSPSTLVSRALDACSFNVPRSEQPRRSPTKHGKCDRHRPEEAWRSVPEGAPSSTASGFRTSQKQPRLIRSGVHAVARAGFERLRRRSRRHIKREEDVRMRRPGSRSAQDVGIRGETADDDVGEDVTNRIPSTPSTATVSEKHRAHADFSESKG